MCEIKHLASCKLDFLSISSRTFARDTKNIMSSYKAIDLEVMLLVYFLLPFSGFFYPDAEEKVMEAADGKML